MEKFWGVKNFSTVMKNDEISFESVLFSTSNIKMPCGGGTKSAKQLPESCYQALCGRKKTSIVPM